jgi:TetR/AcrR family transcriptional regulator, regulator of cefoperazone and chloramphenicol sensitivity
MTEKTPPRRLIIEAVVTCIEKYGIDQLTTRKIAEEAGTNIASINYYFRSKEQLVNEALTMTIQHMIGDLIAVIETPERSFEQVLDEVFFYLIDGVLRFPGISMAHLYGAVVEKRYDSPGGKGINRVFDSLVQRAIRDYPGKDPDDLRLLLSQIVSSVMFMILAPGFFPVAERFRPTNSENCRRLAEQYRRVFLEAA